MKKLIYILFIICFLTSCSSNKIENVIASDISSEDITFEDIVLIYDYQKESYQVASNDMGTYILEYNNPDNSYHLRYIDYLSNQNTLLCSNPSCDHMNETCTAYISSNMGTPEIFLTSTNLFLHTKSSGEYHSIIKKMDLNGENHSTVLTLPPNQKIQGPYIYSNNTIYYVLQDFQTSNARYTIQSLDTTNGVVEEIGEISGMSTVVGATTNSFIIKDSSTDTIKIYTISIDGEVGDIFYEYKNGSAIEFVSNDNFYIVDFDQATVIEVLKDHSQKIIVDLPFKIEPYLSYIHFIGDDFFILDNTDSSYNTKRYYISLKDYTVVEILYQVENYGKNMPMPVEAIYNNFILAIPSYTQREYVYKGQDGVGFSENISTPIYGIFTIDDYVNGTFNYIEITTIN